MRLLLLLLLTACATDNSPQGVCARQAYDDPTVKEIIEQSTSNLVLMNVNQEPLRRAKQVATLKCLQAMGVVRPGGVEAVIQPK